jgi:integrase
MKDKEIVQVQNRVFVYYSNKGLVYRHPTGVNWKDRNLPQNEQLLSSLVKKLRDIIHSYRMEHGANPPRDYVKSWMKDETQQKEGLMDYYREFWNYKSNEVKNGNLQPHSLIDYRTLRSALTEFEKETRKKFQLTDITEDFVNRFKGFLLNKRKLNNNSTKKRLKSLKVFINYCEDKKYFRLDFNFSKIKVKTYDPTVISLTEQEFQQLREWDAGKYQKVKDLFILGCLTSLRFSDLKSIGKHNIINDQIVIKSIKTDVQHLIPLTPTCKEILEKYNYNLNFFTNQTYNRLLKKMAKDSGFFDTEVTVIVQHGNVKKEIRKPKYQFFGSHLARRTNITRNLMKQIPLPVVMSVAGLKQMSTVLKYMEKYGSINDYTKKMEE